MTNYMLDLTDRKNCFYWQTDRNLTVEDYARIFLKRHEISTSDLVAVLEKGIISIVGDKEVAILDPDENVLKGNVNIVRKILVNGERYVVRIHPRGVKNGYFYAEKLALTETSKHGLPVPKVIEIHEATDESDMDFMLMSMSTGETMDVFLKRDDRNEQLLLSECGKLMAKIHEIKVSGFGSFDNEKARNKQLVGLHDSYRDFIHTGLEENLHRLISFNVLTKAQADGMALVFETMNFEPIDGPRLIHNDYADWNLLTDGKTITGILDWDECHAGDPIADLACWSTFFTMQRFAYFLKGYASVTTLPEDYEKRFHFYRLRYTISKMALRVKRLQVDNDEALKERVRVGKLALIEETAWFQI